MAAAVTITPEALEQSERLPLQIQGRVFQVVVRLRKWPEVSGGRPLTGKLAGHYRIRTGDYRVQFRVEGKTVVVEKIGHRDGFYDE